MHFNHQQKRKNEMIDGSKIYMRTPQLTDVDKMLEWENNPQNWEVSGTKEAYNKADIEKLVKSQQGLFADQQMRYLICLKSDDYPIGTLDFFEYNKHKKTVGLGILIAENEHRNKGHATEAIQLAINYCGSELQLSNLFCNIQQDNSASVRLFEKCGFRWVEKRKLNAKPVNYYELTLHRINN